MTVIIGRCKMSIAEADGALEGLEGRIKPMRLFHNLERLVVAAVGGALMDAGRAFPIGDDSVGLYLAIDDSIEDVKDEYLRGIIEEGLIGASPLLFPLTSPNALAAQVSIAFDMRGEGVVMPINGSGSDVIEYATECIDNNQVRKAIVCVIRAGDGNPPLEGRHYFGEVFVIEGGRL